MLAGQYGTVDGPGGGNRAVRYKDNTKEIVPINKISSINDEGQKIPFEPKDLNDYLYGKLYSV